MFHLADVLEVQVNGVFFYCFMPLLILHDFICLYHFYKSFCIDLWKTSVLALVFLKKMSRLSNISFHGPLYCTIDHGSLTEQSCANCAYFTTLTQPGSAQVILQVSTRHFALISLSILRTFKHKFSLEKWYQQDLNSKPIASK